MKIVVPLFGPLVNSKIQGILNLQLFSSTFQGNFNFQGLFKTVLYIQVLFKPVRTLQCSNIAFSQPYTCRLICIL